MMKGVQCSGVKSQRPVGQRLPVADFALSRSNDCLSNGELDNENLPMRDLRLRL